MDSELSLTGVEPRGIAGRGCVEASAERSGSPENSPGRLLTISAAQPAGGDPFAYPLAQSSLCATPVSYQFPLKKTLIHPKKDERLQYTRRRMFTIAQMNADGGEAVNFSDPIHVHDSPRFMRRGVGSGGHLVVEK
jgi:hypothetical protein